MRRSSFSLRGLRRGFTIVELSISLVIFSFVGYALAVVVGVGRESQAIVSGMASIDTQVREATDLITNDLRTTQSSTVTVTTLSDGNSQVRLLQPITVGGSDAWGVFDRHLGQTAAQQNMANWHVQYTVRNTTAVNGNPTKELVRQLLDTNNAVQRTQVLVTGIEPGTANPRGFRVVNTGAIWAVTITTTGDAPSNAGMRASFHVQTRN